MRCPRRTGSRRPTGTAGSSDLSRHTRQERGRRCGTPRSAHLFRSSHAAACALQARPTRHPPPPTSPRECRWSTSARLGSTSSIHVRLSLLCDSLLQTCQRSRRGLCTFSDAQRRQVFGPCAQHHRVSPPARMRQRAAQERPSLLCQVSSVPRVMHATCHQHGCARALRAHVRSRCARPPRAPRAPPRTPCAAPHARRAQRPSPHRMHRTSAR